MKSIRFILLLALLLALPWELVWSQDDTTTVDTFFIYQNHAVPVGNSWDENLQTYLDSVYVTQFVVKDLDSATRMQLDIQWVPLATGRGWLTSLVTTDNKFGEPRTEVLVYQELIDPCDVNADGMVNFIDVYIVWASMFHVGQ